MKTLQTILSAVMALAFAFMPYAPLQYRAAQAATTGITVNQTMLSATPDEQQNFVVSTTFDNDETTAGTYIVVDDAGGGGSFYTGTIGSECNAASPDVDNKFSINQNKGVCYSNSTVGDYTLTVRLFDSADVQIGGDQEIQFVVQDTEFDPNIENPTTASFSITNPKNNGDGVEKGQVVFTAAYVGPTVGDDNIEFFIKEGVCEIGDNDVVAGNVAGNVAGFTDDYTYNSELGLFSSIINTSELPSGAYCFVISLYELESSEGNLQATRTFNLIDKSKTSGGGGRVLLSISHNSSETENRLTNDEVVNELTSSNDDNDGEVLGASTEVKDLLQNFCSPEYISSDEYMYPGVVAPVRSAVKLQLFLRLMEVMNVNVTGLYDAQTVAGVRMFQQRYVSDILTPWNLTEPTGYVYLSTARQINELVCNEDEPSLTNLTPDTDVTNHTRN